MRRFTCPSCRESTIPPGAKFAATSFAPTRCPQCQAPVYPSGKKTYLLRSLESLIVTMIVILALIEFSWRLVALAVVVIAVMETLIFLFVPLVRLKLREPGL